MKAKEIGLLQFIRVAKQFVIPIYQRPYRWDEIQCRRLWEDVMRAGEPVADGSPHFVGSIVYIEANVYQVADQPYLLVIDGQQRLTTFTLLIEALAVEQERRGTVLPGDFEPRKLRHYHLKDTFQDGERAYKLLLSETDRVTLKALVDGAPMPDNYSIRIKENYDRFSEWMKSADLDAMSRGVARVMIVDIALERGHDNPQLIFESLNSTGKALGQSDLIRNYVLMDLQHNQQSKLYEEHWRPMELAFGQEAYAASFDGFVRNYLTMKTGEIARLEDVYDAFKAYAKQCAKDGLAVASLIADMHRFARFYCRIALGKDEKNKALADVFSDIRDLRAEVTFPFLLRLYGDHEVGILGDGDFLAALRLVEAYVFRRTICNIPTNSHNKTFSTFARTIVPDRYLDSIKAQFLSMPSYRRFPSDDEFASGIKTRDLYNIRVRTYWLRRLENHNRKERVPVEEYTIEHIMPQNENLRAEWRADLGPNWQTVQETYLHTLGNLTLTGYNPELSDRPFREKRDMPGGFRDTPIRLSEELRQLDTWNEDIIKVRADRLAAIAVQAWAAPDLSIGDMKNFAVTPDAAEAYTIADHPPLAGGPIGSFFRDLRERILALNPAVTEEFRKLYIVYKTEDVFVSIIAQASNLRLILNMPFQDLQDARGLCRDITNIGHWSTGQVDMHLTPDSDLTYAIGLIRQAYEWQMEAVGE